MKQLSLQEADRSPDIDIKMVAVRASRYRMFGSSEKIPDAEMAVVDLRDGQRPEDFDERFKVLERHPMKQVMLVRKTEG
jgi:hypothetical protein